MYFQPLYQNSWNQIFSYNKSCSISDQWKAKVDVNWLKDKQIDVVDYGKGYSRETSTDERNIAKAKPKNITVMMGSVDPNGNVFGSVGDFYRNEVTGVTFGPKTSDDPAVWPTVGTSDVSHQNSNVKPIPNEISVSNKTNHAERFNLHEEEDPQAWKFYKQQLAQRWDSEEILLHEDKNEFNKLNARYKLLIEDLVAFFAPGDGLVCEQIDQLKAETTDFAQRAFLGEQFSIEVVHARAYKDIILTFFEEEKQRKIFKSVDTLPCVREKADFIVKYMENKKLPLSLRYVAAAVSEGVFFVALFAVIFYIREKKILNHFCFLNEQVSKDEKLHRDFDILMARRGYRKGEFTREQALEVIEEGIKIEMIHIRHILRFYIDDEETDKMGGMTIENMDRFIHTLADQIVVGLGIEATFTNKPVKIARTEGVNAASIYRGDDSESDDDFGNESDFEIESDFDITDPNKIDSESEIDNENEAEFRYDEILVTRDLPTGKLEEFSPGWMKGLSMIRKPNFYEVPVGNYSMISQRKQIGADFDMEDLSALGI